MMMMMMMMSGLDGEMKTLMTRLLMLVTLTLSVIVIPSDASLYHHQRHTREEKFDNSEDSQPPARV